MAYTPYHADWEDYPAVTTPITEAALEHIETGITNAAATADAAIPETVVAAKGDLIVATANDTVTNVTVGADGTVLTAASGEAAGVEWATVSSIPAGAISMYVAATAPSGWLVCDGSAVNRTTYADLFAVIGETYGAGNGTTTFNVPDMLGRVPVGLGTHADVSSLAASDGVSAAARRPKHKHTVNDAAGNQYVLDTAVGGSSNYTTGPYGLATTPTSSVGPQTGSEPTDTPAYLVVQFIIKT